MPDTLKTTEAIDLSPVDLAHMTTARRIRAAGTHTLLAYACDQGVLFHDRRSGLQHIWTWEEVRAILPSIEEK